MNAQIDNRNIIIDQTPHQIRIYHVRHDMIHDISAMKDIQFFDGMGLKIKVVSNAEVKCLA